MTREGGAEKKTTITQLGREVGTGQTQEIWLIKGKPQSPTYEAGYSGAVNRDLVRGGEREKSKAPAEPSKRGKKVI